MRAYCEIHGEIRVRITKEEVKGERTLCQLRLSERGPRLESQGGKGLGLGCTTCAMSAFPEGTLDTS